MADKAIAKVMKFELRYLSGCKDFYDMQHRVWSLQNDTWKILNKTIQMAYMWEAESRAQAEATGIYKDVKEETGYKTLDGYIYDQLKGSFPLINTANLNATIRTAWKRFKDSKMDVFHGEVSLPSYKKDHPLVLHNRTVKLQKEDTDCVAEISLFSNEVKADEIGTRVKFAVLVKDGTQRNIVDRLLRGEYTLGQCLLSYEKKKWFLRVTYRFVPVRVQLDSKRILGLDLGVVFVACASVYGERDRLAIEGDKTFEYAHILEARKRSRQSQARFCGDGRVGHGTKTRVKPAYNDGNRLANHQDTLNHRYSKAIVDYAVKNGCGTIQMEKLEGIKEETGYPRRLAHWTYFDLQQKIKYKAAEKGIEVVQVDPRYTSQRCSSCGHIDRANRPTQDRFLCVKCGFRANADFNASQNLSIARIDEIISGQLQGANNK